MATIYLDPNGDAKADWIETPVGTAWSTLDDGVRQPSTPTLTDYISSTTNQQVSKQDLGDLTLTTNEFITQVIHWVYATTAQYHTIEMSIQGDGIITYTIPESQSAAWFSGTYTPTTPKNQSWANACQAQVKLIESQTQAASSTVYAEYFEVTTAPFPFGISAAGTVSTGQSGASLSITAPSQISASSSSQSAGSVALTAPTQIGLNASSAVSTATCFVSLPPPTFTLNTSAHSAPTLWLRVPMYVSGVSDEVDLREASAGAATLPLLMAPDLPIRMVAYLRSVSDAIAISDSVDRSGGIFARATSDAVSISDTLTNTEAYPRATNDAVSISDAVQSSVLHVRGGAESIDIADTVDHDEYYQRSSSDSASILDSLVAVRSIFVTDGVAVSDGISVHLSKSVDDSLGIDDGVGRATHYVRNTTDSANVNDALVSSFNAHRSTSDALQVDDSSNRNVVVSRETGDFVGMDDDLAQNRKYDRTVVDAILVSDSLITNLLIVRGLADAFQTMDDLSSYKILSRHLFDNATIVDDFDWAKSFTRNANDVLSLQDAYRALYPPVTITLWRKSMTKYVRMPGFENSFETNVLAVTESEISGLLQQEAVALQTPHVVEKVSVLDNRLKAIENPDHSLTLIIEPYEADVDIGDEQIQVGVVVK